MIFEANKLLTKEEEIKLKKVLNLKYIKHDTIFLKAGYFRKNLFLIKSELGKKRFKEIINIIKNDCENFEIKVENTF